MKQIRAWMSRIARLMPTGGRRAGGDQAMTRPEESVTRPAQPAKRPAIVASSSSMASLVDRGDDLVEAGRAAEALAIYEEVIEDYRKARDAQEPGWNHIFPMQALAAYALVGKAHALAALDRLDDALAALDEAIRFQNANEEQGGEEDWIARRAAAEALVEKARLLEGAGRRAEAIECLNGVVRAGYWPSLRAPAAVAKAELQRLHAASGGRSAPAAD